MSADSIVPGSENTQPGSTLSRVNWMSIVLYIILTFGVSWTIWLGLGALGVPFLIRTAIGMFGPALAAVLLRLLRHEGFADAGLRIVARDRPGAWRMYIAAYVLPPILIALGIGVALLSGLQHWALSDTLHQMGRALADALHRQGRPIPFGYTPDQLAAFNLLAQTLLAFIVILPFNMIFTFGEEFGWRGYLLPRLAPLGGIPAAIITGIIWGLWHAPLIVLNSYNYPGHPWLGVLMMVIFTVALGMIFAWLRFRSGSVWPSTLAHAAINAQIGYGIIFLSHADSLLGTPLGILSLIPMIAFAIWLAVTGKLNPAQISVSHEKQPA
ncbi:MAG TPA: CPBP family intramembrane glutamic endopeptidase [Ktedonobacteraceae bacterium]|nr:CPBP family intramembrane glutamic endopeptidase [Ktedonobacteraceae bacterium]